MNYNAKIKRPDMVLEAVIIKANGEKVNLGVIASTKDGTIKLHKVTLWEKLKRWVNKNG